MPRNVQGVKHVRQEENREFKQGTSAHVAQGLGSSMRHEKDTTGLEAELAVKR